MNLEIALQKLGLTNRDIQEKQLVEAYQSQKAQLELLKERAPTDSLRQKRIEQIAEIEEAYAFLQYMPSVAKTHTKTMAVDVAKSQDFNSESKTFIRIANRYEVGERIDAGTGSDLYQGKDLLKGGAILLRIWKGIVPPEERSHLEKVVEQWGELIHPNLVGVLNLTEEQGHTVLVMEGVAGESLLVHSKDSKDLDVDQLYLALENGLAALAHAQYAHGALCPSTILRSGERFRILPPLGIDREALRGFRKPGQLGKDDNQDALARVVYWAITGERSPVVPESLVRGASSELLAFVNKQLCATKSNQQNVKENKPQKMNKEKKETKGSGKSPILMGVLAIVIAAMAFGGYHFYQEKQTQKRAAIAEIWSKKVLDAENHSVFSGFSIEMNKERILRDSIAKQLFDSLENDWPLKIKDLKSKVVEDSIGLQQSLEELNSILKSAQNAKAIVIERFTKMRDMGMTPIPAGCFQMGSINGESDERPVHEVCVSAYWMDTTEVTQNAFQKVMGKNPSEYRDPQRPVEYVTWSQSKAYCEKVGKRLPTEAEWEYAARAGTTTKYYWGDAVQGIGEYAWWEGNSGYETQQVAKKKPNSWGLYDMAGNVCEWTNDWYGNYRSNLQLDPRGASSGQEQVLRGGSWGYEPIYIRSADRDFNEPSGRFNDLGFRCVASVSK